MAQTWNIQSKQWIMVSVKTNRGVFQGCFGLLWPLRQLLQSEGSYDWNDELLEIRSKLNQDLQAPKDRRQK